MVPSELHSLWIFRGALSSHSCGLGYPGPGSIGIGGVVTQVYCTWLTYVPQRVDWSMDFKSNTKIWLPPSRTLCRALKSEVRGRHSSSWTVLGTSMVFSFCCGHTDSVKPCVTWVNPWQHREGGAWDCVIYTCSQFWVVPPKMIWPVKTGVIFFFFFF